MPYKISRTSDTDCKTIGTDFSTVESTYIYPLDLDTNSTISFSGTANGYNYTTTNKEVYASFYTEGDLVATEYNGTTQWTIPATSKVYQYTINDTKSGIRNFIYPLNPAAIVVGIMAKGDGIVSKIHIPGVGIVLLTREWKFYKFYPDSDPQIRNEFYFYKSSVGISGTISYNMHFSVIAIS